MDANTRLQVLADVRQEIKAHERELSELRRLEAFLSRSGQLPLSAPQPSSPPSAEQPTGGAKNPMRAGETQAVEDVLRRAVTPMGIADIAKELVKHYGFKEGKSRAAEKKAFRIMRNRTDLFVRLANSKWTLRELVALPSERNGVPSHRRSDGQSDSASRG